MLLSFRIEQCMNDFEFRVSVSYYQVYLDRVQDLLANNPRNDGAAMEGVPICSMYSCSVFNPDAPSDLLTRVSSSMPAIIMHNHGWVDGVSASTRNGRRGDWENVFRRRACGHDCDVDGMKTGCYCGRDSN